MAKLMHFFPLTIFQTAVKVDEAERQRMVEAIIEMSRERVAQLQPGVAWTGDLNGHELLHNDPRFAKLFASFAQPLHEYLEVFKIDQKRMRLYFTRSWGTVFRRGDSTQAHDHKQSHISLVYYLNKPGDSSGIGFIDKEAANQFAPNIFGPSMARAGILREMNQLNTQKVYVEPQQDEVLIFPSRTLHEIPRSQSEVPRISIACDIVATVVDSTGLEYMLPDPIHWKAVGTKGAPEVRGPVVPLPGVRAR
jgi:uncharacterized protein (TIGR02466 family)